MESMAGLLTTVVPLWMPLAWWLIINPAIEALPAPEKNSNSFYRWFYSFANSVAGNFMEAFKIFPRKK